MMFDIPTISDSFNTWHRIRAPTISRGLLDEWPNRHNVGRPCWVLMKVFFSLMLLITWSSAISCIAAIVHGPNVAHECDFLPLCTCTHSMVTCVGVPIFTLKGTEIYVKIKRTIVKVKNKYTTTYMYLGLSLELFISFFSFKIVLLIEFFNGINW